MKSEHVMVVPKRIRLESQLRIFPLPGSLNSLLAFSSGGENNHGDEDIIESISL